MANEVINGTDVLIFMSSDGTTWGSAAHATSHTLSIQMASRDTSNKGTGNFVTKAPGRLDVSGTLEGMYIDGDTYNYEDFMTAIVARTPVYMFFGGNNNNGTSDPSTSTAGGITFYSSGKFYITGVDATFPDQQNSTYTVKFEHAEGFRNNAMFTS
jgi:hypothetical protein